MSQNAFMFEATEENFQQGVIENSFKAPVLVDFWAEWCEPCKQLTPVLDKLSKELNGQFVLAKVNSETQQGLSQQFQVRSIPTVIIFKNGEVVEQFNGLQTEEHIRQLITRHITTEAEKIRNQALETIQSGDFDGGKEKLLQAEALEPENVTIQIDLAHLEAGNKDYDAAKQRLSRLKFADREKPQVAGLLNKIELALATKNAPSIEELEKTLEQDPANSLARFQLAGQLIHQEQYEIGLEHLLYILTRDRKFQDDAAKNTMLSTFTLLGDEHPLVSQYRRKMFNAMH